MPAIPKVSGVGRFGEWVGAVVVALRGTCVSPVMLQR
jgi:hypothetical protein